MTILSFIGLVFTLVFLGLIMILAVAGRDQTRIEFRKIPGLAKVQHAIELAVEAGTRLHISIGRGSITRQESAAAFVGLSMLEKIASSASSGDLPPVITSGNPSLTILAQDTLKSTYRDIGLIDQYQPNASQLTGVTPFSYVSGAVPVVRDKESETSVMFGSYGMEIALLTEGCYRTGNQCLAGTDDITGQAVLYATTDEPIIGEELYAGGAYLNTNPIHKASLRTQDIMRWILVIGILAGVLLNLLNLNDRVLNLIEGLL